MKYFVTILVLFIFSGIFSFAWAQSSQEEYLEGEVIKVTDQESLQIVNISVTKGTLAGEVIEVVSDPEIISTPAIYKTGDKLVVSYTKNIEGEDIFIITDYQRRDGLIFLFIFFAILAIVIGGKWGLASLIGMAFSFLVIFQFVLPQIVLGRNAILVAVIGSSFIIPVTFSLSHGIKTKTWIASLGTIITLILAGLFSVFAVKITYLTGFGSEEANFLQFQLGDSLDMKGLLLAGMIISSLGILDDITISQASVVAELKNANKKYKAPDLFTRAMRVGRDHIASLINTLVLVYTGASLPLLLLFQNNPRPFSEIVNMELIAEEIVRTLVGSMGLILAVPITTLIAAYYYSKQD